MLFVIQAGQTVVLSRIVRELGEDILLKKTEGRLSRHLLAGVTGLHRASRRQPPTPVLERGASCRESGRGVRDEVSAECDVQETRQVRGRASPFSQWG